MFIIPAIDIFDNKVVRLKKGDFNQISYFPQTPLEQAIVFESFGFKYLHVVDLSGSKTGVISVLEIIKSIKESTDLIIQFGGGIRSKRNVEELFSTGVDRVIIGSLSVNNKTEFEDIVMTFGPQRIIVAADVKDEMIAVKGWTEQTKQSIYSHIEYCCSLGVDSFLCTDISKDGLLSGTNVTLYKNILAGYPEIKLIASGGIKDIKDVKRVLDINAFGVVIGRAIYEGKIDLKELAEIG